MRTPAPFAWFDQFARGWRAYALIGLIALASGLMGAARMPVLDRDEARFTQATRQMLETGDYVRIRNQDDDRNKKPIGIHWLQAASVTAMSPFTERTNEIWPYRIPSALGAMLAAIAALWAGAALLARRAAFLGAALFAGCILLGVEGMIAKTDGVLAGFTTLAMACLARLYARDPTFSLAEKVAGERPDEGRSNSQAPEKRHAPHPLTPTDRSAIGESKSAGPQAARWQGRGGKALALLFWFALGCGVLIKGPVTPLVIGLSLGALALWERRAGWMKPLMWWPGPLLAIVIVAPWMIAIGLATNGQFFVEAISGDLAPKVAGGQEGHFAWPGYHLLLLPFLIFPATFALPAAARRGWQAAHAPRNDAHFASIRFLLCWAVPSFLLFELLPTKLAHYTLPTYPALCLLCGAGLVEAWRVRWPMTRLIGAILFALAGAGLVALVAAGATFVPGDSDADMRRALTTGLIGAGILIACIAALFFAPRPSQRVAAAIVTALSISYTLRERVLPEARILHVSAEATAALTRARLLPRDERPLWVVGYRETSLVFLTRTTIHMADPAEAGVGAALGDALMIEGRALAETEAALAQRGLVFKREGAPVRGRNYGNGDLVALFIGEVADAPAAAPSQ